MGAAAKKRRRAPSEERVSPGSQILLDGQAARVRMVTATSVLVHLEASGIDEWILKTSGRLRSLDGGPPAASPDGGAGAGADEGDAVSEEEVEEDDECCVCGQPGKLTCCDVCPRVYHARCLSSRALLKMNISSG